MKLKTVQELLGAEVKYRATDFDELPVSFVVACDLMSDVLVVDRDDILLITSLSSPQSIKTAHLVGAAGVVYVNNKSLGQGMLELAEELDISVMVTADAKFACCVKLAELFHKQCDE